MKLKENQMYFNDYLHALKQAAKGNQEHLKDLDITQKQALEMLEELDPIAYNNVLHYLITVVQDKEEKNRDKGI